MEVDETESAEVKEVRHPRECIKDFCLYHCEKKEMRNSRRSVSECTMKSCPLWYYRLGKLKWEKPEKDMRKGERMRRVNRLESARKRAEFAEDHLRRAERELKKCEEIVKNKKQTADEARAYVKQLETAFYVTEDPDGIWR